MAQLATGQYDVSAESSPALHLVGGESRPSYTSRYMQGAVSSIEDKINTYAAEHSIPHANPVSKKLTDSVTTAVTGLYNNSKVSWHKRLNTIAETLDTIEKDTTYSTTEKRAASLALTSALRSVSKTNYFDTQAKGRTAKAEDREYLTNLVDRSRDLSSSYRPSRVAVTTLDDVVTDPVAVEPVQTSTPTHSVENYFMTTDWVPPKQNVLDRFSDERAGSLVDRALVYVGVGKISVPRFVENFSLNSVLDGINNKLYNACNKILGRKSVYVGTHFYRTSAQHSSPIAIPVELSPTRYGFFRETEQSKPISRRLRTHKKKRVSKKGRIKSFV